MDIGHLYSTSPDPRPSTRLVDLGIYTWMLGEVGSACVCDDEQVYLVCNVYGTAPPHTHTGRAWMYIALNEQVVESYVRMFIENQEVAQNYYLRFVPSTQPPTHPPTHTHTLREGLCWFIRYFPHCTHTHTQGVICQRCRSECCIGDHSTVYGCCNILVTIALCMVVVIYW